MLNIIDDFLNTITMYRLVLYFLTGLLAAAEALSFFGLLPFSPMGLLYSIFFLTAFCWITNAVSARIFNIPANVESVYITAFILALIISPVSKLDLQALGFLAWAAILSQASKYIFALRRRHVFNPAALAVALTALTISQSASWWIGTAWMLPFVAIGGLLTVRKIQRFGLVIAFVAAALITILGFNLAHGFPLAASLQKILVNSPLIFFASVMLTEPLTTPPTRGWQIFYGSLTGILFAPQLHLASLYSTPELALLAGNIFSYAVSPKKKLLLTLQKKIQRSPSVYDFVFSADSAMEFYAGQYMEWTLGHDKPDARGNRRYFTVASAPTEGEIMIGVKFYNPSSSFKQAMLAMQPGQHMLAGQLAGDFMLPKDPAEKLVFIAGGIGITPFRSMLQYLIDTGQRRDIVVFYSNKSPADMVYGEILDKAYEKLGIKTVRTLTDAAQAPADWQGKTGSINDPMIAEAVPDFAKRIFYVSGPRSMVTAFEKVLSGMGIPKNQIKTDFFPGFA